MPPDTAALQRTMRVLRLSFIVAGVLFIYVTYSIPVKPVTPVSSSLQLIFAFIAFVDVALGFFAPHFFARIPASTSPAKPVTTPVQRWFTTCIFSLALFTSCNLFAVVLHNIGARIQLVALLFTVGMAALIFWNPGPPPTEDPNQPLG